MFRKSIYVSTDSRTVRRRRKHRTPQFRKLSVTRTLDTVARLTTVIRSLPVSPTICSRRPPRSLSNRMWRSQIVLRVTASTPRRTPGTILTWRTSTSSSTISSICTSSSSSRIQRNTTSLCRLCPGTRCHPEAATVRVHRNCIRSTPQTSGLLQRHSHNSRFRHRIRHSSQRLEAREVTDFRLRRCPLPHIRSTCGETATRSAAATHRM